MGSSLCSPDVPPPAGARWEVGSPAMDGFVATLAARSLRTVWGILMDKIPLPHPLCWHRGQGVRGNEKHEDEEAHRSLLTSLCCWSCSWGWHRRHDCATWHQSRRDSFSTAWCLPAPCCLSLTSSVLAVAQRAESSPRTRRPRRGVPAAPAVSWCTPSSRRAPRPPGTSSGPWPSRRSWQKRWKSTTGS